MTASGAAPSRTLAELDVGDVAYVRTVNVDGLLRRRLLDLGFVPGAKVEVVLPNPVGDPRGYRIRDTTIALRDADAQLMVVRASPPDEKRDPCEASRLRKHQPCRPPKDRKPLMEGDFQYVVALAGNPNTGKSTVFNALTGLRQHVGNWPGKTVTRAEGSFVHRQSRFRLVDLPGTYSLLSATTEEEIARDYILFGAPDCTVVVVDATCLVRNLNLVLQILEITDRVVVCVNLIDEARRKGLRIEPEQLQDDLGVPVVLTAARSGEGLTTFVDRVYDVATGAFAAEPVRIPFESDLQRAVDALVPLVERAFPGLPNARWIAMRLIDGGDLRLRHEIRIGLLADLTGRIGDTSILAGSPDAKEIAS